MSLFTMKPFRSNISNHRMPSKMAAAPKTDASSPSEVYHALLAYETDGSNPADGRRVILQERMRLETAMKQSDTNETFRIARDAARTLDMWVANRYR